MEKKYYYSIDAFKFLFMLVVCLCHMKGAIGYIQNEDPAADFFFILSGALLYKSFLSHPHTGVLDYTLNKYKRFFTEWCIALVLTYLMYHWNVPFTEGVQGVVNYSFRFLSELLLLQDTGIFPRGENPPGWYLSVLLWGGALVYAALQISKRVSIKLIFPSVVVLFYAYTFHADMNARIADWQFCGPLYLPFARGIAAMCMGVLLSHFYQCKRQEIASQRLTLINITSILSALLMLVVFLYPVRYEVYSLIFLPLIILGCYTERSSFNRIFSQPIWKRAGSITFEMLIVHMLVRGVILHFEWYQYIHRGILAIIYIAMIVVAAVALKKAGTYINNSIASQAS